MICLDTTVLVDLWRAQGRPTPLLRLAGGHLQKKVIVPVTAAGEFLEGAALVGNERVATTLNFIRAYEVAGYTLETALIYARIVAELRAGRKHLPGVSKLDLWHAACAIEHGAMLLTKNIKHFHAIKNLKLLTY